jgi:hypothetical protein
MCGRRRGCIETALHAAILILNVGRVGTHDVRMFTPHHLGVWRCVHVAAQLHCSRGRHVPLRHPWVVVCGGGVYFGCKWAGGESTEQWAKQRHGTACSTQAPAAVHLSPLCHPAEWRGFHAPAIALVSFEESSWLPAPATPLVRLGGAAGSLPLHCCEAQLASPATSLL